MGRQGLESDKNEVVWPACRDVKPVVMLGCGGSSSAAEGLWLFPLSCFVVPGEGQLSLWSGRVPE